MRTSIALAALTAALTLTAVALAQETASEVIQNAIRAQGGKAMLAKLRSMRTKLEGTTDFVPDHPGLPFKMEEAWRMPDKHRTTSTIQFMGRRSVRTEVVDGKSGWTRSDGKTEPLSPNELAALKDQYYVEDLDRLSFVDDKSAKLSTIDNIDVDGKTAAGILVRSKGHGDVKLYFDKASGLLVKREHQLYDAFSGRNMTQEAYFKDYRQMNGLTQYGRLVLYRDGKKVVDARVTEAKFIQGADAKLFAVP